MVTYDQKHQFRRENYSKKIYSFLLIDRFDVFIQLEKGISRDLKLFYIQLKNNISLRLKQYHRI